MMTDTPEFYVPSLSEQGDYVDVVTYIPPVGIRCPCTNRVYEKKALFKLHTASSVHMAALFRITRKLFSRLLVLAATWDAT